MIWKSSGLFVKTNSMHEVLSEIIKQMDYV